MRRLSMLLPVVVALVACKKTETPAADTAAAAAPVAPAPVPVAVVAVTEADVGGTWKGTSSPMGSDSVIAKWTQVCAAGTCKGSSEGNKAVISSTYTLAGDSAVGVSKPYAIPAAKGAKGPTIVDHWTVHFKGDSASGTGVMNLASKPDSVVMAYHFTGTKQH
jgi:hypothetical protein